MKNDLKILTWNCNGAFRKKFESIEKYNADIYVIQECENPDTTDDINYKKWANDYLWVGDNKNKGLGIFVKGIRLTHQKWQENGEKYFIACRINNEFDLVAVWNQSNGSGTFRYIGQFWKYLQTNKCHMNNCLILGDFNSNKIWDKRRRICNHSDVVRELDEIGIVSVYHERLKIPQGVEKHPTFFLQKNINKPYHIDYIFASRGLADKINDFEIGLRDEWLLKSDHLPLVCSISKN